MDNYRAFISSSSKNYLDIAEWLWDLSIKNDLPINIYIIGEAFITSCLYNNINSAEWLWKKSKEIGKIIDIHKNNEEYFLRICTHSNIDTIKWFLNLSNNSKSPINIEINNNYIFKQICSMGRSLAANYLCELCSKYKIIDDACNDGIKYVIIDDIILHDKNDKIKI